MFEHHVDVHALAGDVPDRLAEFARLFQPLIVFGRIDRGHLAPAIEILAVDHTFRTHGHDKLALVLLRDDTDGIGARRIGKLDRIGAKPARSPPDQHVLAGLQLVRGMAEQHPVGGGQRQRIAGAFFPSQVLWARHQLLRLHAGELREGPVRRLITPDALGGRHHRIAAVAFLVIAVVLVAMDHDLVPDLPCLDGRSHLPDDPGRIGTGDVIGLLVPVKGADGLAQSSPDPIVVDACGHHQNQHLVAVDLPCVNDLDLKALLRLAMPLTPDRPGIHLLGHIAEGRHFPDFIEVFFRRVIGRYSGMRIQSHFNLRFWSLCQPCCVMPQCRIAALTLGIKLAAQYCNCNKHLFVIL